MPSTRPVNGHSKLHPHYRQPPKVPASVANAFIQAVADHFETTPSKLLAQRLSGGGAPGSQPTIQRQLAIYVLRRGTGMHMDLIAGRFSRSRTTIIRTMAIVDRKLKERSKAYITALEGIRSLLTERRVAGLCDRCAIACSPGPLCWECDELHVGQPNAVLTNGLSTPKSSGTGRTGGAGRADMPPGSKAKPPRARSGDGGFKSRR